MSSITAQYGDRAKTVVMISAALAQGWTVNEKRLVFSSNCTLPYLDSINLWCFLWISASLNSQSEIAESLSKDQIIPQYSWDLILGGGIFQMKIPLNKHKFELSGKGNPRVLIQEDIKLGPKTTLQDLDDFFDGKQQPRINHPSCFIRAALVKFDSTKMFVKDEFEEFESAAVISGALREQNRRRH